MKFRILIAHDGSRQADDAVALVAGADWPAGTVVRVVTVIPPTADAVVDREAADAAEAEATVDRVRRRLEAAALSTDVVIRRGRAATAILDEARSFSATLVVVGSRGLGAIASAFLGSVAREVVDDATCPVLVARRPRRSRVLFATDASDGAQIAERALTELPFAATAEVRVLSVAEIVRPMHSGIAPTLVGSAYEWQAAYEAEAREVHEAIATEAASRLRERGLAATAAARLGGPAVEVVADAAAWGADLVVLGSRGRRGLRRFLLGSVARSVLNEAGCSVLVVREPAGSRTRRVLDPGALVPV